MKPVHIVVLTLWALVCAANNLYWGWVIGYVLGGGS